MSRSPYATDISREEFETVRPMFEAARRRTRPRKHDLYDVFCAVLYFVGTEATWRGMPADFPPWRTVHEYFTQWTTARHGERSLLEQALTILAREDLLARLRPLLVPR